MPAALTRRSLLFGAAAVSMAQDLQPVTSAVDHLLLGAPDLDRGIDWVDKRLGLRAAIGGVHPGAGTRNALLSLGSGHYLEIIAPDPAQPDVPDDRRLRTLAGPRLISFAVTTTDIDAVAASAKRARLQVFGPRQGSRRVPSGALLEWKTLAIRNDLGADAIQPVPFFIQWSPGSPHPSADAPQGCALELLEFEHSDPVRLNLLFEALGLDANVASRPDVRIVATLRTPHGRLELR